MTTEEIRKLTKEELLAKLAELRKTLAETEFQVRINKEKNFSMIKKTKKDIARLLTIMKEANMENIEKVKKEKLTTKNKNERIEK